jgi:hypothetical protein
VSGSQWSHQTSTAPAVPGWLTLSQLNRQIEALVRGQFSGAYLVVAEVESFRRPGGSACAFVDLIEQQQGRTVARMSCIIYPAAFQRICREFDRAGMRLPEAGMKVLSRARVQFHSRHGLQLNIESMDPSYILGERERRKQEVITRLRREGLTHRNKARSFPLVPQHVAIISSRSAAGYGDFVGQLERNSGGWRFEAGERKPPDPDFLRQLAKSYDQAPENLFRRAGYLEPADQLTFAENDVVRAYNFVVSDPRLPAQFIPREPVPLEMMRLLVDEEVLGYLLMMWQRLTGKNPFTTWIPIAQEGSPWTS